MDSFDLVIRGGTVVTSSETSRCDVGIRDGRIAALAERLLSFLRSRNSVRIIGNPSADRGRRVPTISFIAENHRSDEVVTRVDEHRIGIRYGDFYARRLIEKLGLTLYGGVIRVSMVHYNTVSEVDRLVEAFDQIL